MKKNILVLVFTFIFLFFFSSQVFSVEKDGSGWTDFFGLFPSEEFIKTETETDSKLNVIVEMPVVNEEPKPERLESEILNKGVVKAPRQNLIVKEKKLVNPQSLTPGALSKNMVSLPPKDKKSSIDAESFRDPFLILRGGNKGAEKVLKPGVTIDGVLFNSYNDSDLFIEKVYRDSNFRIKDVFGKVEHLEGGGCLYCHRGIEKISKNHKFRCTKCHEGNRRKRTLPGAHRNLIANPSDLNHAPQYCGKCHAEQIEQVGQSAMATGKSVINVTRYAWGAQGKEEYLYSLRPKEENGELTLPSSSEGKPVDSFLRTKCMRCHLQSEAPHRPGEYRAGGCAACHMIYSNDGHTVTQDRAIQSKVRKNQSERENRFQRKFSAKGLRNPRAYPVMHKFTTAIPSVQCEHCHNNNGIGNEFEGLFSPAARPHSGLQKIGADKPVLYGTEHEFLLPDIHRERGMHCIDCHVASDLKGTSSSTVLHGGVKIRCENCHGTPTIEPKGLLLDEANPKTKQLLASNALNPNLKKKIKTGDEVLINSGGVPLSHIKREKDKWILFSRVTGKKHYIPVLKDKKLVVAHRIKRHIEAIECHACHARWSTGEWGMHVIREESLDLSKWKDWNFSDPTLQSILWDKDKDNTGMLDWLSVKRVGGKLVGSSVPGFYLNILTDVDWNTMILGKNQRGKYSIMKPRYQYFLTDKSKYGEIPEKRMQVPITKDGGPGLIFLPHTPHTIRQTVRPCESCHDSEIALGLGEPTRNLITDSESFLATLGEGPINSNFQAKQVVTQTGDPIQRTYPVDQTRFLNIEEIKAIKNKNDAYKSFRYMALRERRFPRLLAREEFPYDQRHKNNERLAGEPKKEKDILFNINKKSFVVLPDRESLPLAKNFSGADSVPSTDQEDLSKQRQNLNKGPVRSEKIMEFSRDYFKASPSNEALLPNEDIPINGSKQNSEGLQ